jgi:hypothetical protein
MFMWRSLPKFYVLLLLPLTFLPLSHFHVKKSSKVVCTFTSSFNILTIFTFSCEEVFQSFMYFYFFLWHSYHCHIFMWRSLPKFYVLLLLPLTFLPLSHFHVKKSSIVLCTFTSSFDILTIVTFLCLESLPKCYALLLLPLTFLPLSHFHA